MKAARFVAAMALLAVGCTDKEPNPGTGDAGAACDDPGATCDDAATDDAGDGHEAGVAAVIDDALLSWEASETEVHVVGAPGAVAPPGAEVEVIGTLAGQTFNAVVEADGSFSVLLPASVADFVQVRATLGDGPSSVSYLFADGHTARQSAELSCEQRADLALGHLAAVAGEADKRCARDADCVLVPVASGCGSLCTGSAHSRAGLERIEVNRTALDRSFCAGAEAEGCLDAQAACTWLEGKEARCLEKSCEVFEAQRPTARVHALDKYWNAFDSGIYQLWVADANGAPAMLGSWSGRFSDNYDVPVNDDGHPEFVIRPVGFSERVEPIANEPNWQDKNGARYVVTDLSAGEHGLVVLKNRLFVGRPLMDAEFDTLNESKLDFSGPDLHLHILNYVAGLAQDIPAFGVGPELCVPNQPTTLDQEWTLPPVEAGAVTFRFFTDDSCMSPLSDEDLFRNILATRTEELHPSASPGGHVLLLLVDTATDPGPAFLEVLGVALTPE